MGETVEKIGESALNLQNACMYILKGNLAVSDVVYQLYKTGIQTTPIVLMAASFIGMALSIQLAKEFVITYGAVRFIGGMIALSMIREIAPVFTAVAVVGNVGASIAAEIGSMMVTEQIDALKVFNISPIQYLVVPRLLSTAIITPVLGILGAAMSIIAGMLINQWLVDIPQSIFLDSMRNVVSLQDIGVMILKSTLFGILIGIISCSFGLTTQGGAEAVGNTTTRAVVWGLLAIFIVNYIITSLFFQVGLS